MTAKTAKTAVAKVAEAATETSTGAGKSMSTAIKAASSLMGTYFTVGRTAIQGVVEVDKALLGYAQDAVSEYVELGKDTMKAKSINDVIDLHVARAHARIETNAANAREVVELTRQKVEETYAPVKDVIDSYRKVDAA